MAKKSTSTELYEWVSKPWNACRLSHSFASDFRDYSKSLAVWKFKLPSKQMLQRQCSSSGELSESFCFSRAKTFAIANAWTKLNLKCSSSHDSCMICPILKFLDPKYRAWYALRIYRGIQCHYSILLWVLETAALKRAILQSANDILNKTYLHILELFFCICLYCTSWNPKKTCSGKCIKLSIWYQWSFS